MFVAHRQVPNRRRELRERVFALVEARLGSRIICGRCKATVKTYGDLCVAALGESCPGFAAIDAAKTEAEKEVGLRGSTTAEPQRDGK